MKLDSVIVQELTGLVAAYNFDSNTVKDGVITDVSGQGNDGTINGPILTRDGMKSNNTTTDGISFNPYILSSPPIWTVATRINNYVVSGTLNFIIGNTAGTKNLGVGGSTHNYVFMRDSGGNYRLWDGSGNTIAVTDDSIATLEHDLVFTSDGTNVHLYVDGVSKGYITPTTTQLSINRIFNGYSTTTLGTILEFKDLKIYNYAVDAQFAKAYHNSFIKPTLIQDFSNHPVGSIANPQGTGVYEIEEKVNTDIEVITNAADRNFTSDTGYWTVNAGWSISGGYLVAASGTITGVNKMGLFTVGNWYKHTVVISSCTAGRLAIRYGSSYYYLSSTTPMSAGTYTVYLKADNTTGGLYADGVSTFTGTIDSYSIKDLGTSLNTLSSLTTGTKELVCDTEGTYPIQSKNAYGTWEFNVNKGADGNATTIGLATSTTEATSNGYRVDISNTEYIRLVASGSSTLFVTNTSYINNNTDYRIKVARLKSEGVFKDIPTLQKSDLANSDGGVRDYTTFTSHGRYGFSATSDGSGTHICGTADEISIVNTEKYLVEFDLKLNSGTAPNVALKSNTGLAGNSSDSFTSTEGRNSIILTCTNTTTGALGFYNNLTVTDYEVSGLQIRRIYDKDSFAVFIKGGDYGDTETGWTLVRPEQFSGTNPVTNSNYTTSEYFVADLDNSDRISNITINNEVEQ
jgi:hypothetical protein